MNRIVGVLVLSTAFVWTGQAHAFCAYDTPGDTALQQNIYCTGKFLTAPRGASWTVTDNGTLPIHWTMYVNSLAADIWP